jgi:hypothetical protein
MCVTKKKNNNLVTFPSQIRLYIYNYGYIFLPFIYLFVQLIAK